MSQYHPYESSYSIDWLLPIIHGKCFGPHYTILSDSHRVNAFSSSHFSYHSFQGKLSSCQPFAFLLTFWVSHPRANCSYFILFLHSIYLCMFHFNDGGYINALLQHISSCRHQIIIREVDLEISQYLGACRPQWKVSTCPPMSTPHLLSVGWLYKCSTSIHLFTLIRMY